MTVKPQLVRSYFQYQHRSFSNVTAQMDRKNNTEVLKKVVVKSAQEIESNKALPSHEALPSKSKRRRHWKKQYGHNINRIKKSMYDTFDTYLKEDLGQIKKYNHEFKRPSLERIRFDFSKENVTFADFFKPGKLLSSITQYLKSETPTEYQKRFFAVTRSFLSTVAQGDQGSGRSTALLMHAINLKRPFSRGFGINSLIIVRNKETVEYYKKLADNMLSNISTKNKQTGDDAKKNANVIQGLYRADETTEAKQNDLLNTIPTPHVLVTTPHRLLDLISSKGMGFLKIKNLSMIAVDDFETMAPANFTESERQAPVVQLLDYVTKLQQLNSRYDLPNTQMVFNIGQNTGDFVEQIKQKEWINWNKFVSLATFCKAEELPYRNSVAKNVCVSPILISPYSNKIGKKLKINLFDATKIEFGDSMPEWLDKRVSYGNFGEDDYMYIKQRNIKRSTMSSNLKKIETEIFIFGLIKLMKKKDSPIGNKKFLLVHPDEISGFQIHELLEKSNKISKIFDVKADLDFFITPETIDKSDPQILTINTSALSSIPFKGLNEIVCLGIDTLKSVQNFASIAGRFRDSTGLISQNQFGDFGDNKSEPTSKPENNIIILLPELDFEYRERKFLEKLLLCCGLVDQRPVIGVTESKYDESAYISQLVESDHSFELDEYEDEDEETSDPDFGYGVVEKIEN
ncbi:hypothetical protein BVG19_g3445 [[Candida] boidinii]|nr:hypothetical protein BVG19_g3445 [[Candida] boidinii]OWB51185.1 hypothetical protein B5S27_g2744 [[Candida] boidinii]